MKKLLSPYCPDWARNLATLILRIVVATIVIPAHGWVKLTTFSEKKNEFLDLFGMGMPTSLALATFGEFFCSVLIVLGLFTRFAAFCQVLLFAVIVLLVHEMDVTNTAQLPFALLGCVLAIMLLGPGKISLDALIFKNKN